MSSRPPQTLSHYRLIERLGRGGMGEVWLAEDTDLPRQVAIKLLAPHLSENDDAMTRLQREAQAMASIDHPCVVTVYEAGQAEGIPYIVMQKLDGDTLNAKLNVGAMPVAEALPIVAKVADALAEAHALGVVHRDLKPGNIMLTSRGPVILDFGLASVSSQTRLTQDGTAVGTPVAMSPEQINGEPPCNQSDLWSLGVILYEMLTGEPPFKGDASEAIFYQVLNTDPEPPSAIQSDIPADLDYIVMKLLRKKVEHRYMRAEELLADLNNLTSRMSDVQTTAAHAKETTAPRLAVLPFEVLSSDPEDKYLAEGLVEDLIVDLTRVEGLRTASRAEVAPFADQSMPPRTLARQLHADCILVGSVRRAGNRGRISAQLVRASDGHTMWADRFDRTLDDLFDVQAEISKQIVSALQVALKPGESDMLTRAPTKVPEAYTLYLKSRELADKSPEDSRRAENMLRQALELDADFALGHAALGWCLAHRGSKWWAGLEIADEALDCARRALELEPGLPDAYKVEVIAKRLRGDAPGALQAIDKVLAVDADDPEALEAAAWSYMAMDKPQKALPIFERLDVESPKHAVFMPLCYEMLGRKDEALRADERQVEVLLEMLQRDPSDATTRSRLATSLIRLDRAEEGVEQARRAAAIGQDDSRVRYNLACSYALTGRSEEAITALKEAVKNLPSHLSDWPARDPDMESLHDHPEFIRLFGKSSD